MKLSQWTKWTEIGRLKTCTRRSVTQKERERLSVKERGYLIVSPFAR